MIDQDTLRGRIKRLLPIWEAGADSLPDIAAQVQQWGIDAVRQKSHGDRQGAAPQAVLDALDAAYDNRNSRTAVLKYVREALGHLNAAAQGTTPAAKARRERRNAVKVAQQPLLGMGHRVGADGRPVRLKVTQRPRFWGQHHALKERITKELARAGIRVDPLELIIKNNGRAFLTLETSMAPKVDRALRNIRARVIRKREGSHITEWQFVMSAARSAKAPFYDFPHREHDRILADLKRAGFRPDFVYKYSDGTFRASVELRDAPKMEAALRRVRSQILRKREVAGMMVFDFRYLGRKSAARKSPVQSALQRATTYRKEGN